MILIKQSSVARIDSIGVLGDKYVSISVGDPDCSQMEQDDWIRTVEALDIISYTKVTGILNNTDDISHKVNNILGSNEEIEAASLAKSLKDLELITRIKDGNGLIHTLIYDEDLTKRINSIMRKMDNSATNLDDAIAMSKQEMAWHTNSSMERMASRLPDNCNLSLAHWKNLRQIFKPKRD